MGPEQRRSGPWAKGSRTRPLLHDGIRRGGGRSTPGADPYHASSLPRSTLGWTAPARCKTASKRQARLSYSGPQDGCPSAPRRRLRLGFFRRLSPGQRSDANGASGELQACRVGNPWQRGELHLSSMQGLRGPRCASGRPTLEFRSESPRGNLGAWSLPVPRVPRALTETRSQGSEEPYRLSVPARPTPTMLSRVTRPDSAASSMSSVPAGRMGTTR